MDTKKPKEKRFIRITKKMGAPIKLTKEIHDKVINAIKMGSYVETAAALAGLSKETYYAWLKKGAKQKKGIYRNFSDAINEALAFSEYRDLATIDRIAHGTKTVYLMDKDGNYVRNSEGDLIVVTEAKEANWTAAAWKLERKFPKKWGRHDRIDLEDRKETAASVTDLIAQLSDGLDDESEDD